VNPSAGRQKSMLGEGQNGTDAGSTGGGVHPAHTPDEQVPGVVHEASRQPQSASDAQPRVLLVSASGATK